MTCARISVQRGLLDESGALDKIISDNFPVQANGRAVWRSLLWSAVAIFLILRTLISKEKVS